MSNETETTTTAPADDKEIRIYSPNPPKQPGEDTLEVFLNNHRQLFTFDMLPSEVLNIQFTGQTEKQQEYILSQNTVMNFRIEEIGVIYIGRIEKPENNYIIKSIEGLRYKTALNNSLSELGYSIPFLSEDASNMIMNILTTPDIKLKMQPAFYLMEYGHEVPDPRKLLNITEDAGFNSSIDGIMGDIFNQ
jgi:hypothetical protein